jgi:hypothetical protein
MKLFQLLIAISVATLLATPCFAQAPSPAASPATGHQVPAGAPGQMTKADMEKMMAQMVELGKPGDNHKVLADMVGSWNYTVKMWMDPTPGAKPEESKGTAVRKSIMGGRYFVTDVSGQMEMPGPDGKKKEMDFKGMSIEAYDNIKKKFVSTWIDNMSTMVMMAEGTYDPAAKTFTYNAECEMMPGMHTKIREVIKIADKDHHTFEWYENRGGQEAKTMEINYTRKK